MHVFARVEAAVEILNEEGQLTLVEKNQVQNGNQLTAC